MAASPAGVRPWHYSETLLKGFANQPPYRGCGLSTDCHGTGMATLLESATRPDGRLVGKAARTATLKRGWRAFLKVADSNGIPDTDDYIRIHRAQFPGTPDPVQFKTRDFDQVVAKLRAGYALSIALRMRALGSPNSVDFTTADHQVLIWGTPKDGEVWCMGPMRPHSDEYAGHRAKLAEVRKAAVAFQVDIAATGGQVLTWLYPIGGWTQAALKTQKLRADLRALSSRNTKLEARLVNKDATIADLRAQLEAGSDPDCSNARAAAREQALVQAVDAVDALRAA